MKKLITILAFFALSLSFGQVIPVNALKIKGITSVQRDGLTINAGEFPIIYNTTAGEFQRWNGAAWETWDADAVAAVESVNGEVGVVALDLGLTGNTLSLTGDGTTVDLSGYLDNTDTQDLSFVGTTLSLTNGGSVDLSSLQDGTGTDDQTASEVNIADAGGLITATTVEGALQENRTAINLNTAKVTNATHTGEVTGATSLTIASGVVDSDNIANGTIDEVDLDASVNASLDLADSSVQPGDIDTFAELDAIVADKSLANLNDAQVFSSNIDFSSGIDVTGNIAATGNLDITGNITSAGASMVVSSVSPRISARGEAGGFPGYEWYENGVRQWGLTHNGNADYLYLFNNANAQTFNVYQNGNVNIPGGNLSITGNLTATGSVTASDINLSSIPTPTISSNGSVQVIIDADANDVSTFTVASSGPTTRFSVTEDGNVSALGNITATGDLQVNGGDIGGTGSIDINLDTDNNGTESFNIVDGADATVFSVTEGGVVTGVDAAEVPILDAGGLITATDVEGALAELAGGGLADNGQGLSSVTKSSGVLEIYDNEDITVSGSDIQKRRWNRHTTNDTILLGTTITLYDQPWLETNWGADSLYIKRDAGVNLYIPDSTNAVSADGLILKGRETATIIATGSGSFYAVCNCTLHNEATCTADPNEFNTTANATSDPNCNESSATTGWSATTSIGSVTSQSTGQNVGSYAVSGTLTQVNAGYITFTFSATAGDVFTITADLKSTQANVNAGATAWTNVTGGPSGDYITANGTWVSKTWSGVTVTSTGNVGLRFYASPSGSGQIGDNIWVDNLSIVKTN